MSAAMRVTGPGGKNGCRKPLEFSSEKVLKRKIVSISRVSSICISPSLQLQGACFLFGRVWASRLLPVLVDLYILPGFRKAFGHVPLLQEFFMIFRPPP